MKIGVVVDRFPSLSETFVLDQVHGLLERGFEVGVICNENAVEQYKSGRPGDWQALSDNTVCWWGGAGRLRPFLRRWSGSLWDKSSTAIDILFSDKLRNFDVIIAHFGGNGLRIARVLKRRKIAVPLVTIFHGNDVGVPLHDNTLWRYKPIFEHGGLQLTVNDLFRRVLIDAGAPPDQVMVQHMGVRTDEIGYSWRSWDQGMLRFISVCRLTEKKGIEFALRALGALSKSRPRLDWNYTIIGSGELLHTLQRLAESLEIADRVTFLGNRPHDEVKQSLRQAHVFLLPSVTAADGDMEGIPVALMEAMAAGLIVVSTDHSGIPELIADQKTGFLAPERDVETLAGKLAWIAGNPLECERVSLAARRKIEADFNAQILADRLAQIVTRLAEAKAAA
ncbi:colanic acid biosynthesis glycosyltransferase WcaL [Phyllobacterium phragmitis]|uniref:Colanic acid biosynthesis glycosyltransferase WcaL n=1 Tax=Phyllobacterium phragmitis TaxID=2670329 RepID=A0A2S9IW10_9HYPH|nr:glycosyltransferase [Phyllobacterium phragmitis]PRD44713.1 colanic acid biosynthesis glycosyltransferase WcaL [Phyllobacterium phragmitis]